MTAHTCLTLDERDAIDAARGRIRRIAWLARSVADYSGDDTPASDVLASSYSDALPDLLELVTDDVAKIDDMFKAADARLEAERATVGA